MYENILCTPLGTFFLEIVFRFHNMSIDTSQFHGNILCENHSLLLLFFDFIQFSTETELKRITVVGHRIVL